VQVFPDPGLEGDTPSLAVVAVARTVRVPGEDVALPADLGPREPVPAAGGPGSAWAIDLGADRVPCARLSFDVLDEEFARPYTLELAGEGGRQLLASGEWRRRRGEEPRPLEVAFPEVRARGLRLVVTDSRNPPLNLRAVRCTAAAREVVFAPGPAAPPFRLYSGNLQAQAPRYDFAAALPDNLEPAPERAALGPPEKNPDHRPPPTLRAPHLLQRPEAGDQGPALAGGQPVDAAAE
jgi:hypothetical protein